MSPEPKVNILLVDDRAENLLALEAILDSLGQNLVRANSGQEALRQLLDRDFAVILLDVQMPDMDGFETAELIRARPRNQSIPIIFITAFSKSDGLVFRGYDAGAVDYLLKPVVPEILRSKVAVFIDLFNKTAEVQQQAEQLAEANKILQNAHDYLEIRVKERTAELSNANKELRLTIAEQHRTEAALRESEGRFRLMANCAPVMIWIGDIHASCTFVNQGWLAFTGRSLEEEMGQGWAKGIHPEDVQRCLNTYHIAFDAHLSFEMEYRLKRADGTYGWIFDRANPWFLADGSFAGYIGSCIEFTDRKRAEAALYQAKLELEQRVAERTRELSESNAALRNEILERQQTEMALRQSETRYRAIVEDQTELICRFLPDGVITFANEAYCRFFGITQQALVGNRYEPVIVADDREKVAQLVRSMNRENPTVMIENRVIVDGEMRWTQWINRSLFNEQGDFIEFQSVGRDITAQKQAEFALAESQQSIQKIADTAPVILYVYDLIEERNVYINREITELLGYSPEELQAMGPSLLQVLLHPDDLALTPERYSRWKTVSEGDIIQTEYRMRHKDGEWRYLQSQETLFARTPDGLPRQILCAAVDITAAKQLAEVRRAEEQLQASLHEKEVLLKEIHHRVKNNLQIVDSLLRLHSRQVKDAQVAEILLESQNRIKSIALIHEKLYQSEDLARIQFTEYIPNLVIHLFSSYKINASAVALKVQVDDIALEIDIAIPCGLIINELVSNALKYAFPADRSGEIRVEFRADPNRMITLTVSDNGIGMPEQFDPIETKSLGLKLVWGLVEQLEGTIALDRHQGTRFTIIFPGDQA